MKHVIYCFFSCLLVTFLLFGCAKAPPKRQTWLAQEFCAELRGTLHGVAFAATLSASAEGRTLTLSYHSPKPLCGITLCIGPHAVGEECDKIGITSQKISSVQSREALKGLLLPVTELLRLTRSEFKSVQRHGRDYCFGFPDGATLCTDAHGTPKSISVREIAYTVTRWEYAESAYVSSASSCSSSNTKCSKNEVPTA